MEERDRREGQTEEMEQGQEPERTDTARRTEETAEYEKKIKNKRKKDNRQQGGMERGKYRLTGSLGVKVLAFFLLAVSALTGFGALIGCFYIGDYGFYVDGPQELLQSRLRGPAEAVLYDVIGHIEQGDLKGAKAFCEDRNVDVEMIREESNGAQTVLWGTWNGDSTPYTSELYYRFDLKETVWVNGCALQTDEPYLFRAYVDPLFPKDDNLRRMKELVMEVYDVRYILIGAAAAGIVLCILLFVFLMCSAGHQNGREDIVPGVLASIPFDVLTVLYAMAALAILYFGLNVLWYGSDMAQFLLIVVEGAFMAVLGTLYCMEFAVRLKRGKCFRYTLIYMALRGLWRMFRFLGRGFLRLLRDLPLVMTVVTAYLGLCILEFFGILVFLSGRRDLSVFLWAMEKVALFVVVTYIALACRRLLDAGRALAEGEADYKVDISRLIWNFKEHGENLNSLGQGISKAVAERLKSERLKTELITNVSHDLKTPLTSIINYADLICEETMADGRFGPGKAAQAQRAHGENVTAGMDGGADMERAREGSDPDISRIAEYAQVLLRQSRRLKKLLEDLLEASKATTGNLEVNLEPCEAGVLLSQAVGEYQQRMEEKQLDLIARQPEEIAAIMADGRHLWRVFDNLLNNICKYAQEHSRVYLSVEERDKTVLIIFRNMSKYPLDISSQELEERFVRGDKSRHMEGNGLGLSIAKSLVELQGGRMEITIDGDLFKVTLEFAAI